MMSHLYGDTTTRAAKDSVMGYYEGKINQSASNDVQYLYNRIQAEQEKQNKLSEKLEEEKSSLAEYEAKIEKLISNFVMLLLQKKFKKKEIV